MIGGTTEVGVSLLGSAPLRYEAELEWLSLTERSRDDRVGDATSLVTVDDIDGDAFRYRITVEGFGVEEYYEYDEPKSEPEVAEEWLCDVGENWGSAFSDLFEGNVEADALWTTTTSAQDSEDSPIVLPPPEEETE